MNEKSLSRKGGVGKDWLPEIPPLISIKDAAFLLGSSIRTVYRMIQESVFNVFKVRGSTKLSSKEVLDYINGKKKRLPA